MTTTDKETAYLARAKRNLDDALEAAADTFSSKAAQKRVLDDLNRAYNDARDAYGEIYRVELFANDEAAGGRDAWDAAAFLDAREVPFDLHHVRDLHVERIGEYSAEAANIVRAARFIRAEVKAAEIVPPVKADAAEKEAEARVQRSIREEMDRLGKMYHEALDLGRIFNGLPVSANVHMVTNAHGTTFLRAFYYLNGKRTPINVILAAAQTLADEARA